jgi:hypothetical protein
MCLLKSLKWMRSRRHPVRFEVGERARAVGRARERACGCPKSRHFLAREDRTKTRLARLALL